MHVYVHVYYATCADVLVPVTLSSLPGAPQPSGSYNVVGTPAMAGTGSVLMIYGLSTGKINCEHIFNLLCSYGNVLKVSIVMSRSTDGVLCCN